MPKMLNLAIFWKPKACGQTELPERSVLIGQKLVENGQIQKFKCDILGYFQTLYSSGNLVEQSSNLLTLRWFLRSFSIFTSLCFQKDQWRSRTAAEGGDRAIVP